MRAIVPLLLGAGCAHPNTASEPHGGLPAAPFAYRRGVHVAHWLGRLLPDYTGHSGIPHTYAAPWFDDEDLAWIAGHGFDHVQIHVDAEQWLSDSGALLEPKLAPFDAILEAAGQRRLGVVLLLEGAAVDPLDPAAVERGAEGWRRIAERFADVGDGLRLRTDEDAAPAARYLAAIRASSPERFVYLPVPLAADGDPADPLGHLGEPAAWDGRTGLSFSYFRPEVFALQLPRQPVRVPFPGEVPDFGDLSGPGYAEWYVPFARAAVRGAPLGTEAVDAEFAALGAWMAERARGREVYLGEFGLFEGSDPQSARRYLGSVVRAAERHGVGWSIYDYESGRAIRGEDGEPTPLYTGLGLDLGG
jgi:hypothetical protein